MLWLLACVDPYPPRPGGDSAAGSDSDTDTDTDTDTDADADTDTDTDTRTGGTGDTAPVTTTTEDPLAALSDEFDVDGGEWAWLHDAETLPNRVSAWDVGATDPGWLRIVPTASAWFDQYRGLFRFVALSGDFALTTRVSAADLARAGAPDTTFAIAGAMVRAPGDGLEDWMVVAVGTGQEPGVWTTEIKNTEDGASLRNELPASDGDTTLRIARVGGLVVALLDDGIGWSVRGRELRDDLPRMVQVGLAVAADFETCGLLGTAGYDAGVIPGAADLDVRFDYARFRTPVVPEALSGRDPNSLSDPELLSFLGDALD
ncbi:MAG: hypothetical protein ABMB14_23980 [Myxococcota bacterium]